MIRKFSVSCMRGLAAPLVALAVLGFSGCSGNGNATNTAPDDAGSIPADAGLSTRSKLAAMKKSGKSAREIRDYIREKMAAKVRPDPKTSGAESGRRP